MTVWDYRARKEVMSVKQCEDYISDLICDDDQRYLVASSGEGTITSFSLRSRTVHTQVSRGERAVPGGWGRGNWTGVIAAGYR